MNDPVKKTAASRSDSRHAIIDIGSNTVRLVIYGGARRAPTVLFNEKVAARLGSDLVTTGELGADSVKIALAGLGRYAAILSGLGIREVEVVATAAVRDARDGPQFLEDVRTLGLSPQLLSGEEEARASATGVLAAFPGATGVVTDLGGGSLELVSISPEGCADGVSLPLGTLRLPGLPATGPGSFRNVVSKALRGAGWNHPAEGALYLVGGTFRNLAVHALKRSESVLDDPHGLELSLADATALAKDVTRTRPETLVEMSGLSEMRATALPHSAHLLLELLGVLGPRKVVFSSWGLREGLMFDKLDPLARTQDPLLAGVAAFTAPRGGDPAFAARVASWTVSARQPDEKGSERLRLAATMLALASSQIEPNFREQHSIDWALHKRWIDCDAQGRAMIATALSANCGKTSPPDVVGDLASPDAIKEAMGWGLAIRLCRRLGANSLSALEASVLRAGKNRLRLYVGESQKALVTRTVEKDLGRLAAALGLTPHCQTVPDEELLEQRYRQQVSEPQVTP